MRYDQILEGFSKEGRLRVLPIHRGSTSFIDLCSNDYMGLAARENEFMPEFHNRFGNPGMTSSASRLLAKNQDIYLQLESWISSAYGKEALLFNSGYHANVGVISALSVPGTLWLSDKLIHASAIDGIRLGGAEYRRFRHNDTTHVRKLIEKDWQNYERVIILCESVYSMDGDIAPIEEYVALKKEFPNVLLYVDEAHGLGVFGKTGLGFCQEINLIDDIDILIGTLGKACASSGAFVVTASEIKNYLINSARSLIFSTALAPINAAWSLLMLEKLEDMNAEREHLKRVSQLFRTGIENITGESNPSMSPIVPLMTGSAEKAVEISKKLEEAGVLALPIRRPTVPPGGERIRFSLNASLTEKVIEHLLDTIKRAYES